MNVDTVYDKTHPEFNAFVVQAKSITEEKQTSRAEDSSESDELSSTLEVLQKICSYSTIFC